MESTPELEIVRIRRGFDRVGDGDGEALPDIGDSAAHLSTSFRREL